MPRLRYLQDYSKWNLNPAISLKLCIGRTCNYRRVCCQGKNGTPKYIINFLYHSTLPQSIINTHDSFPTPVLLPLLEIQIVNSQSRDLPLMLICYYQFIRILIYKMRESLTDSRACRLTALGHIHIPVHSFLRVLRSLFLHFTQLMDSIPHHHALVNKDGFVASPLESLVHS